MADGFNDAADGMIVAADLLMKTCIAITLADAFTPGVGLLEEIKTVTMYASLGLDIAATGVALGGFFNTVRAQSAEAGTRVRVGSTITLTIV